MGRRPAPAGLSAARRRRCRTADGRRHGPGRRGLLGLPACARSSQPSWSSASWGPARPRSAGWSHRALGREFIDTDLMIERATRMTISELFQREGELSFRRREMAAIDRAISVPGRVIAVGGGAVLSAENRTALKQAGLLVYLRATPRPWPAGSPGSPTGRCSRTPPTGPAASATCWSPAAPSAETAGDVAIASPTATTSSRSPSTSLDWYRRRVGAHGRPLTRQVAASVPVPHAGGGYTGAHRERADVDRLDEAASELPGAEAAAVVSSPPLAAVAGRVGGLTRRRLAVHQLEVPVGEEAKRLAVVRLGCTSGWPRSRPAGPTRWWPSAAEPPPTWPGSRPRPGCCGVPLVNVPTTVLGMVDAAVRGKTGVDLEAGKNLVGSFHQPVAVVADLDTLAGLPTAEVRSGLAEVAKAGLVGDPALAEALARLGQGRPWPATQPPSPPGRGARSRSRQPWSARTSTRTAVPRWVGRRVGNRVPRWVGGPELRGSPHPATPWSGWPGTMGCGTGRRWRSAHGVRGQGGRGRSGWPGRGWPTAAIELLAAVGLPVGGVTPRPRPGPGRHGHRRSSARACAWSCCATSSQPEVVTSQTARSWSRHPSSLRTSVKTCRGPGRGRWLLVLHGPQPGCAGPARPRALRRPRPGPDHGPAGQAGRRARPGRGRPPVRPRGRPGRGPALRRPAAGWPPPCATQGAGSPLCGPRRRRGLGIPVVEVHLSERPRHASAGATTWPWPRWPPP